MTDTPGTPLPALFSPLQIAVASLIGGPIPACWLFARNYHQLSEPRKARNAIAWGVGGLIALVALSMVLPPSFPRAAIPIGYTFGLYYTAQHIHGAMVRDLVAAGVSPGSWTEVFKVSVAVLLVMLALLLAAELLFARA